MEQHWTGYLNAVGNAKVPSTTMPSVAPYDTTSNEQGVSGFMDLINMQPKIQARYDAMSGSWEGVQAADKAISNGVFRTEALPLKQKTGK